MNIRLIGLMGLIGLIGLIGNFAGAQSSPAVYFETTAESFAPGSEFTAIIFIDSDEPVNAFSFEISYNPRNLEFISFNNNASIVDFWRDNPQLIENGILKIEGGASNPFVGKAGEIIKLNFRAKEEGRVQISFRTADLYYADGLGTRALVGSSFIDITVSSEAPLTTLGALVLTDKTPPVILDVKVAKNPVDNSRLAVFSVADRESGIEKVFLRSRHWFIWDEWQTVSNPARLAAGVWAFQLRAVDNQNNSAKKTVYVGAELFKKILYITLPIILAYGIYTILKNHRKKESVIINK